MKFTKFHSKICIFFDFKSIITRSILHQIKIIIYQNEASKKYCALRSNIKRKDSVYDKLSEILSISKNEENLNFLYALNMLFLQGYMPKINYEEKTWFYKEPLEKASTTYIKKIKTIRKINEDEENRIKQFLKDISHNGYIEEEINSTISTLIWSLE